MSLKSYLRSFNFFCSAVKYKSVVFISLSPSLSSESTSFYPGSFTGLISLIDCVSGRMLSSSSIAMHVLQLLRLKIKRSLKRGCTI